MRASWPAAKGGRGWRGQCPCPLQRAPGCHRENYNERGYLTSLKAAEDLPGPGLWEASPIPHQGDSKPESYRWEGVGQVGKPHGRRKRSEFRIRKTWGPRPSPTSRAGTDSSFSMPFSSA